MIPSEPAEHCAQLALPPVGPIETSLVVPSDHSYWSVAVSVSAAVNRASVLKTTCLPSGVAQRKADSPPVPASAGPVEISVVTPSERM